MKPDSSQKCGPRLRKRWQFPGGQPRPCTGNSATCAAKSTSTATTATEALPHAATSTPTPRAACLVISELLRLEQCTAEHPRCQLPAAEPLSAENLSLHRLLLQWPWARTTPRKSTTCQDQGWPRSRTNHHLGVRVCFPVLLNSLLVSAHTALPPEPPMLDPSRQRAKDPSSPASPVTRWNLLDQSDGLQAQTDFNTRRTTDDVWHKTVYSVHVD